MEVDSDSSSGSVILITERVQEDPEGIQENPELQMRPVKTSVPAARNSKQNDRQRHVLVMEITPGEKRDSTSKSEFLEEMKTPRQNKRRQSASSNRRLTKERDPTSKSEFLEEIKTPRQNKRRQSASSNPRLTQEVEKVQGLGGPVKTTATVWRNCDSKEGDVDTSSGSDTKSIEGSRKRDPLTISALLKRIKTLTQNNRRKKSRFTRLTNEVRSLKEKISVQAAYIDVLCGMLGDDMKEKFRGRQGMGILGDAERDDDHENDGAPVTRSEKGIWHPVDAATSDSDSSDQALKKKELEFCFVEDLDDVEDDEDSASRSGSPGDTWIPKKDNASFKHIEATGIKDETVGEDVAKPHDIAAPSTSFGIVGKGITDKEVPANEMSALTIAVGKEDPVHMMCNAFAQSDGNQVSSNDGKDGIRHGLFSPSKKRICEYGGQVGESASAQAPREAIHAPYEEMRVQVAEPVPPKISSVVSMGNHEVILLPAANITADDPLNVGSGNPSSFGPLVIDTSRMKIGQATTSSHEPLNIESFHEYHPKRSHIVGPRALPDQFDSIGSNQPTALIISVPSSTELPPQAASDLPEMPHQERHEWESPTQPELQLPELSHHERHEWDSPTLPQLSLPLLSDLDSVHSNDEHQDYDCGNMSPNPQVLDDLIYQLL